MATASTLGFALLGLLAREPLSGYDLAQIMKERIRHFWTAQHSQIYPELAKLEAARLVTHEVERQSGRPDRKVFAITKEGRAALVEWVEKPFERAAVRDEALLKVYCALGADPEVLARNLDAYARELGEALRELEVMEDVIASKFEREVENRKSGVFFGHATLRLGIEVTRTRAEWCAWLVKRLKTAEKAKKAKKKRAR